MSEQDSKMKSAEEVGLVPSTEEVMITLVLTIAVQARAENINQSTIARMEARINTKYPAMQRPEYLSACVKAGLVVDYELR